MKYFLAVAGLCFVAMATPRPHATGIVRPPSAPPAPTPIRRPPLIELPPPPALPASAHAFLLSTGGRNLILDFETGGRSGYNPRPEWPKGASGVTVGIGYDMGYYRPSVIESDWHALDANYRAQLEGVSGITGQRARAAVRTVHDVYVQWQIATDVFDRVDVAREFANAKRAMPGFQDLRPNCQAALLSLGFNRGWAMAGANRTEMREIRELVPSRDYDGIALQLRKMVRVWSGTSIYSGMRRRRFAEADLVLTP